MQTELLQEILKIVHQAGFINPKDIPFSEWVVETCAKNQCGMYGKTWQCPPGVGTLKQLKAKCLAFSKAIVFTTCHQLEDSFDIEGMHEGRIKHEKITDQTVKFFKGKSIRVLSAEGCKLCEKCTYPTAPCRFPEKARSSVEANGISVVDLAKQMGINYKNGNNTIIYFSVILYD